ncbi:MAG: LysR family transcriptional regulator, partial [Streptosporangiales bacterium]|nr:LysR family transcriptional regulator [Streptosporangiales bacterium]
TPTLEPPPEPRRTTSPAAWPRGLCAGASREHDRRVELRHLRYFVAVAEELHFGRAAERLHVVQPALSKQVSALEKELGVRLLERTKRRVELTDAGVAFLADAHDILSRADKASARARAAGRGESGELVIGFIPPALNSVLPVALRTYRRLFPDVRLVLRELTNRAAVDGVLGDRLHIAFARVPFETTDLRYETVYEEPVAAAIPAEHPLAAYDSIPLAALRGEPLVMIPRTQEPELHDYYVALCQEAGFSPRIVHGVTTTLVAVGLAASGVGIAFVPESTRVMAREGVVYRPLRDPQPRFRLAAAWRGDPGPLLEAFLATRPWTLPLHT